MLAAVISILLFMIPVIVYFVRRAQASTPSLRWPALARVLRLRYEGGPPRMLGQWNGRDVAVEAVDGRVRLSMALARPSRLRVEIGPRAVVQKRAGIVVPDPVATGDEEFEARYLARCSDKAAGATLVDPLLRQRVLAQPSLDLLGQGDRVWCFLSAAEELEAIEAALGVVHSVAEAMEVHG